MSTGGHTYRVGREYFVDNAALQLLAQRVVVEPMLGGYQMLLADAVVRFAHVTHAPLPEQSGRLYHCARADRRDVGPSLRALAGAPSGEWEQWPRNVALQQGCGCHATATASASPEAPCACKLKPAAGEGAPQDRGVKTHDVKTAALELLDALSPGCLVRLQEHDEGVQTAFVVEALQVIADTVHRAATFGRFNTGPGDSRTGNNVELAKTLLVDLQQIVTESIDGLGWDVEVGKFLPRKR
mgnify:CR=1 FL=1